MLRKRKKSVPALALACRQLKVAAAVGKLNEENTGWFLAFYHRVTNLWNQLIIKSYIGGSWGKRLHFKEETNMTLFYLLQKVVLVSKDPLEERVFLQS